MVKKNRRGELHKGVILYHDSAAKTKTDFELVERPLYLPDLHPSD